MVLFIALNILLFCGCGSTDYAGFLSKKEVVSFYYDSENHEEIAAPLEAQISGNSIRAIFPNGTVFPIELIPSFEIEGYAFFVSGERQTSGETEQLFNEETPLNYTLYSYDGTCDDYTVTLLESDAYFETFRFDSAENELDEPVEAQISGNTVWFYIPQDIELTQLTPSFTTSSTTTSVQRNGAVQTSSQSTLDFVIPQNYRLYAEDSAGGEYFFEYQVSAYRITDISLPAAENGFTHDLHGIINNDSIRFAVLPGTDLAGLTPQFKFLGSSVTWNGRVVESNEGIIDCTEDGKLTVHTGTGLSHSYTLSVTTAGIICDAGANRTVNTGKVTIQGSAQSATENDNITYSWAQSGPDTLTLSDASTATPSFEVQQSTTQGAYTFTLTATSSTGVVATDSAVITVDTTPTLNVYLRDIAFEKVTVKWDTDVEDIATVAVQYAPEGGSMTLSGIETSATGTATISGLENETIYTIDITATDIGGNSITKTLTAKTGSTTHYIYTPADLAGVGTNSGDYEGWILGHNYIVMQDIDIASYANWIPIGGSSGSFSGIFDGNGHSISNLTVDRSEDYSGLFGAIGGAGKIRNLSLINAEVNGKDNVGLLVGHISEGTITDCSVSGSVNEAGLYVGMYAGMIAGQNNGGTIAGCSVSGSVKGSEKFVGGLVGNNTEIIENCTATVAVEGHNNFVGGLVGGNSGTVRGCYVITTGDDGVKGLNRTGGLVGSNGPSGTVENSSVIGVVNGTANVGGLIGYNDSTIPIINCSSRATVIGGNYTGGLIGYNHNDIIQFCYSAGSVTGTSSVGGLVGGNAGTVNDSFYDTEIISGQSDNLYGTRKTTTEMKNVVTYTDTSSPVLNNAWDFVNNPNNDGGNLDIWDIDGVTNDGYPFLRGLLP
ncbi:MAG: hypothetical protein JXK07_14670 [Spirochaetes bacterium]|nr:hypothetical protein [Spirochaetota bacterium]